MKIGERLKYERNKLNLTQAEVALNLSVARQTISAWENERSYPDIQNLVALSDLYHISLDILLREDELIMEHIKKESTIVKKSYSILQISYLANIGLLTMVIVSNLVNFPDFIITLISTLFYLNISILLIFKQIVRKQQFSYKSILRIIGFFLLALVAIIFFVFITQPNNASNISFNIGLSTTILVKVLGFLLIFFPVKNTEL